MLVTPEAQVSYPDEVGVKGLAHFAVPLNMEIPFNDRLYEVEVRYLTNFL